MVFFAYPNVWTNTMTEIETTPKRRRWWLILLSSAVALVVLIVGGIFAAGSMMGEDVTSSVSMTFSQSPETVWTAIADYERNPISASMRRNTTPLPDEGPGPTWQEDIGSTIITIQTVETAKPTRLVRFFKDSIVPMTSRVEYLLETEGDGTKVTMNGLTTIKNGTWHVPLFRVIQRIAPNAGSIAYLTDLRAHLNMDTKEKDPTNDLS
jgi:hypothetical protein